MNKIQFHVAGGTRQKSFLEIVGIAKFTGDSYQISTVDRCGDMHYFYVWPLRKWSDNSPDVLFLDGKTYTKKDLYIYCSNWITENMLNTLEAGDD